MRRPTRRNVFSVLVTPFFQQQTLDEMRSSQCVGAPRIRVDSPLGPRLAPAEEQQRQVRPRR